MTTNQDALRMALEEIKDLLLLAKIQGSRKDCNGLIERAELLVNAALLVHPASKENIREQIVSKLEYAIDCIKGDEYRALDPIHDVIDIVNNLFVESDK